MQFGLHLEKTVRKGTELTLMLTLEIAMRCERVELQMSAMHVSQPEGEKESVHQTVKKGGKYQKGIPKQGAEKKERQCYRCGRLDYFAKDPTCLARGQECR